MKVKGNRVKIISLGCSKNLVDSEFIAASLNNNGLQLVDESSRCDTVILNTCGFIDAAKKESIDTILELVDEKKNRKIKNLFVSGCLSERYMLNLKKEIPEVDKYFGSTDKPKTIRQILETFGIDYRKNLLGERKISTPGHFAYLKISEGCTNPCSFCAIPIMRGKHKSKPIDLIIDEAKMLADKGVKELIVIGQDTTYWGYDINGKRELSKLLEKLCGIEGIRWIRLMYAYPSRFPFDVIKVFNNEKKICKYIDIPIQHISDKVLKSMRRGITKSKTIALLEKLRNDIKDITLRTTIITGYPAEGESEFKEMLDFVRDFKFERLGVFTYSHEEDTIAYKMKDLIPEKEKLDRQRLIMESQQKISLENNKNMTGKKIKVLIDRIENNYFIGRTERDAPEIDQEVIINIDKNIKPGNFENILIYDYEEFDLFGEKV